MDNLNLDTVFNAACDHEPTKEETSILNYLLDKEYTDTGEAIVTAFLVGRFTR